MAEHGIDEAMYASDGYKYRPFLSCLCGDGWRGDTWEEVGKKLDDHLSHAPEGAKITPQEARERVLKAAPDAVVLESISHYVVGVYEGVSFLVLGHGDTEDEAWLSAANSDRVKQFHKEA